MDRPYIMAIDQGTSGTRVILFDHAGDIRANAHREVTTLYPKPGWVEHDPLEIWGSVLDCAAEALRQGRVGAERIAAIGITNQRESVVLWDKASGRPVYNAINWQCRRTSARCDQLREQGYGETIQKKTGLVLDPYFSATKIEWIMDHVDGVRSQVERGRLCAGNIDSWLMWRLSGGGYHVTDYSNASRTMLLNIHTLQWDEELLDLFGIPAGLLPGLRPSSGPLACTSREVFFGAEVPITGAAGDQQSATFGQACFEPGTVKSTYGTAIAIIMNSGTRPTISRNGLLSDLVWKVGEQPAGYGLEGGILGGGSVVQWLRDGLGVIGSSSECSRLAEQVPDTKGVYLVPAFAGLLAPHWDSYARGLLIGLTAGTGKAHIARAALESMAYQSRDVLEAMKADTGMALKAVRVDGGATKSDFLLQFQADILGIPLEKPLITEMTALGACYLAGLGVGFWASQEEISRHWKMARRFEPRMGEGRREELYRHWRRAVERSKRWEEEAGDRR